MKGSKRQAVVKVKVKAEVKVEVEKTVHKFDVGKRCFNRLLPIAYCPIHQYNMLRNEKR